MEYIVNITNGQDVVSIKKQRNLSDGLYAITFCIM